MNAFSASLLVEHAPSLKDDARRIAMFDKDAVKSILEIEDSVLVAKTDCLREVYKTAIGETAVYHEMVSGALAALIAGIIGFLAVIFSKGGSSPSWSSSSSAPTKTSDGKPIPKVKINNPILKPSAPPAAKEALVKKARTIGKIKIKKYRLMDMFLKDDIGRAMDDAFDNALKNSSDIDSETMAKIGQSMQSIEGIVMNAINYVRSGGNGDLDKIVQDCNDFAEGMRIGKTLIHDAFSSIFNMDYDEVEVDADQYLKEKPDFIKQLKSDGTIDIDDKKFKDIMNNKFPEDQTKSMLEQIKRVCGEIEAKKDVDENHGKLFRAIQTMIGALESFMTSIQRESYNVCEIVKKCMLEQVKEMNKIAAAVQAGKNPNTLDESGAYPIYEYIPEMVSLIDEAEQSFAEYEEFETLKHYSESIDEMVTRTNMRVHEYQQKGVNEEALTFSDTSLTDAQKFQRLVHINETVGDKIKTAYYKGINALKDIFAKFLEKLRANFTTTKNYLEKYKKIILEQKYLSTYKLQDIETGARRVMNSQVPPLDFNKLQTLDDMAAFFDSIKPSIGGNKQVPNDFSNVQNQATYWKVYFCTEQSEKSMGPDELQKLIKGSMYDFLYDIRKTERAIKKSIDDIEKYVKNVVAKAGADADNEVTQTGETKPEQPAQQQQPPASQVQGVEHNSAICYSYLYQKYLTLNEHGIIVEAEKVSSPAASASGGAAPAAQVQGVKNVAERDQNSDDSAVVKQTHRPIIEKRCENYVAVCSTFLKAKMTACEFIRNEAMTVIRDHVQGYIGHEAKPNNQQQQPQQTAQKQQPQQQPQNPQPKK